MFFGFYGSELLIFLFFCDSAEETEVEEVTAGRGICIRGAS
jgi:hypothetical protein